MKNKEIIPNENWVRISYPEWDCDESGEYDEMYFLDLKNRKIYFVKFYFDTSGSKEACDWAEEMLGVTHCEHGHTELTFNYDPVNPQGYVSWYASAPKYTWKEVDGEHQRVINGHYEPSLAVYDAPYTHMVITEVDEPLFKVGIQLNDHDIVRCMANMDRLDECKQHMKHSEFMAIYKRVFRKDGD